MFSLHEIDRIAWILFLLMGAWVVVNILVDLSGDKARYSDSLEERMIPDDRRDHRD